MSNIDYADQFRFANKELNLTRRELQYQQTYAQAAWELYDQQTQVQHSIMVLKGVHVDLLSEYLIWQKRNPQSQRPESKERLDLLLKHLDVISKVQTDNYALSWNNGQMRQEIWELKNEVNDLKKQLQLTSARL